MAARVEWRFMLLNKIHRHLVRRVGCFTRALTPAPFPEDLPAGLSARELDPHGDFQALCEHRPDVPAAQLRERFALGHRCFATLRQEQVVHSMWIACGRAHVPYLQRDIIIPEGLAYPFDSWTTVQFRRQGLGKWRKQVMEACLLNDGTRHLVGLVALHNTAGMAVVKAAHYRYLGYYQGLKLGPWIRLSAHPEPGRQLPELR